MKEHGHLSLVKRSAGEDEPLTVAALRERLAAHAAAVAAVADEWAVREAPVSFKDVERRRFARSCSRSRASRSCCSWRSARST